MTSLMVVTMNNGGNHYLFIAYNKVRVIQSLGQDDIMVEFAITVNFILTKRTYR